MKKVVACIMLFVLFWGVIAGSIEIANSRLWWWLLVGVGPVMGFLWLYGWMRELLRQGARAYQGTAAFAFVILSFGMMGTLFAFGFVASGKLGGPVRFSYDVNNVATDPVAGSVTTKPEPAADFMDCMYLSIATAATFGYGDLRPTGVGRLLACIEAIQFLTFLGAAGALLGRAFQGTKASGTFSANAPGPFFQGPPVSGTFSISARQ